MTGASQINLQALARVDLFAELPASELAALAACLRRRRFARGEVVFLQGDPGTTLYVIESGRVKIVRTSPEGKEAQLNLLGPGDFFGDLALLDGEPRSADAVTVEPSQLLLLQRDDFLRFLEGHPSVAQKLLAVLSRRLRRNAQIVQDAAFLDVPARLARALLDLAEPQGEGDPPALVVTTRLTQAELAAMIGATRESVNKWLGFFERQGFIRRNRGRIAIVNPAGLRRRIA